MTDETQWKNRIISMGTKKASQFTAHPNNWRKHPQRQRSAVRGSLDSLGWVDVVIENKTTGHVVDGHERIWNALKNGDAEVPYIEVELTEAEEAQALLSLDAIAALAETDGDNVQALLEQVQTDNADVMKFLSDFAAESGLDWNQPPQGDAEPQIDRAAELLEKWQVKTGDLWQIGNHRLLCGDSTKREDVERVMGGERAALFATDPPYGVDYVEKARYMNALGYVHSQAATETDIQNDGGLDAVDLFEKTLLAWKEYTGQCAFYVWHSDRYRTEFEVLLKSIGVHVHETIIWVKPNFVISRMDYHPRHEPCIYGWTDSHIFRGERNQTTLWEIGRENDGIHPTQKPVEVFEIPMKNNTVVGDVCAEPFSGSGSQLVACENLGRRGRGIEISPAYCAVTLERLATAFPEIVIKRVD